MDEFCRCACCSRTPLIGEEVAVFARRGPSESAVCDQCRDKPRARSLGEPARRERIRSVAGAATVQRIIPRPLAPQPQIAGHSV